MYEVVAAGPQYNLKWALHILSLGTNRFNSKDNVFQKTRMNLKTAKISNYVNSIHSIIINQSTYIVFHNESKK